ncbi:hypothetical protein OP10G_3165 [Fimbriimonas ginsengisoli Gsoil 348]|uniref:Exo-alpha-sialidase n=1 Tax=Fimbriimonas ginsengisoli Gsoil 348 TaxID=661478 RepID=A0A068NSM6_FIMGI|nr:hypothetical protein OP10G_3165 [Fimbriimonas ginsengisoli Gsoil 348]
MKWTGTATGTGGADEAACVDGVNCDTFSLVVSGTPTDWAAAKRLIDIKAEWTNQVNDYDLYIHKDSNAGPVVASSGTGAPGTKEEATIDPSKSGTGTYTVHIVYYAVTPQIDQPKGSATVIPMPTVPTRNAIYGRLGMSFSSNTTVKAPVTESDGEPSSRTDAQGNHYIAGIRGVPAGVDLWYFDLRPGSRGYDPKMRNPIYRSQPDSFTGLDVASLGADGGGDVDLAVGFGGDGPNNVPNLAFSSLVAANISTARSQDLGNSFTLNPIGNVTGGVPADDRQWLEFFGPKTVYMFYRTLEPAVTMIQRSTDGGLTYGPARTAGQIGQAGSIAVDKRDGTVYIAGSNGQIAVGIPDPVTGEPLSYTVRQAASDPNGVAHIFFVTKVADDGTLYVCYSNGQNIYLKHSFDKGVTWSLPVRVNNGPNNVTCMMPWMATGPVPGSVGIVYYGTASPANNDTATWKVFYAQTFNATADTPTIHLDPVSDHYIHYGPISESGLEVTGAGHNRNLLDYFQISFDPLGAAVIGYTDDHNDFTGNCFVTRQLTGLGISGTALPTPQEGPDLPAFAPLSTDGSQVVDFPMDVANGLLAVIPNRDPLDILSIKYTAEGTGADRAIVARMKVSDLSKLGSLMNWRMNFTANALYAGLNGTQQYSNGLSDSGDQFYLKASTDATGAAAYEWGTGARLPDGSMSYTKVGAATGSIDKTNNTITVQVPIAALNPLVTHGPPIGSGSMLCGFRGQAYTSVSGSIRRDGTRGGTVYKVP